MASTDLAGPSDPGDETPSRTHATHLVARLTGWRFALVAFALVAVVVLADVVLSFRLLDPATVTTAGGRGFPGDGLLLGLFRADGVWYDTIATDGYWFRGTDVQGPIPFFPAYPLAMRVLGWVLLDPIIAGMVLTLASGAGATVLLHRWTRDELGPEAARWAVWTFLLYPFAYYLYGPVYVHAFVVCAALGAFVLAERDHLVLAGLVGAVATASRPEGTAVAIGLVAVTLHRRWAAGRRIRPGDAGVLLSFTGLMAWSAYLWSRFDDPFLFARVQQAWGQKPGPDTWLKGDYLDRLPQLSEWIADVSAGTTVHDPHPWVRLIFLGSLTLQAAIAMVAIVAAVGVFRRLGWGYGVYVGVTVGFLVMSTDDFAGLGRYLLLAFPCFAVVGAWFADHRGAAWVWLPVSAVLLLVISSALARGYFLG